MPNPVFKRTRSIVERDIMKCVDELEKVECSKLWFQKQRNVFRMLDPDNKGFTSHDAIYDVLSRWKTHANLSPDQSKEMEQLFTKLWNDLGIKGTLTFDRLCKIKYVLMTNKELREDLLGFTSEMAATWFKIIDTDRDGIISRDEWKVYYKCIGVMDEKDAEASFEIIDLNKDGKISMEEFVKGLGEFQFGQEKGKYDIMLGPLSEA